MVILIEYYRIYFFWWNHQTRFKLVHFSLKKPQNLELVNPKYVTLRTTYFSALKGVLHPRLVFGLFLHFSQKLQHIGNK